MVALRRSSVAELNANAHALMSDAGRLGETHFYLTAQPDLADREHAHGPPQPPEDAIGRFARHLGASRAQTLASDEPARARARVLTTAELHQQHDRVRQELNAFPARQARTLETLHDEADRQREELSDVELRIGQTNHRIDALGLFKRHGTEGEDLRRQAQRLESQHAHAEQQHVETIEAIAAQHADNDPVAWVDRHAEQIRYLRALEDELSARDRNAERQLVVAAQIDPPDHITAVLGPRPEISMAATARSQAGRIERLSEPPQHDLSIGRDTGLSIDL